MPAPGSVTAIAVLTLPSTSCGISSCLRLSEAKRWIDFVLNWLTPQIQAMPARERAISSMKIDWIVQFPPWPPSSSSMPIPKKPASAMSCHSCSGKFEPS